MLFKLSKSQELWQKLQKNDKLKTYMTAKKTNKSSLSRTLSKNDRLLVSKKFELSPVSPNDF